MNRLAASLCSLVLLCVVAAGQTPQMNHIVVVPFENHSYSTVVGSSAMPYLNSLIQQNGLATNFYANVPGSIGDYFAITTGQNVSTTVGYTGPFTGDNLARIINGMGKTWKVYAQSLPSVGYLGNSGSTYPYVKWHNPFAYFSDVVNDPNQAANIVPFSQLSADVANNTLPNYSLVIPDNYNNAHDCPGGASSCTDFDKLHAADLFLQNNLPALMNTPEFQQDGLLVIWFDEGSSGDTANGGGHTAVVLIGPKVNQGYQSSTFYRDANLLRTIIEALGGTDFPAASATAAPMDDFFQGSTTPPPPPPAGCAAPATSPAVNICSPAAGSTVASPVSVSATARWDGSTVAHMRVYIDGVAKCESTTSTIACSIGLTNGSHTVYVNTWNSAGKVIVAKQTFTVGSGTPTPPLPPPPTPPPPSGCSAGSTTPSVNICSPTAGSTVGSPVTFSATARWDGTTITHMRVYVDSVGRCDSTTSTITCSVSLAVGKHSLVVNTWNKSGAVIKGSETFTVQ